MKHFQGKKIFFFRLKSSHFLFNKDLSILWFLITTVSSMTISPHGGYLSVDEGMDFYVECIGNNSKWIIAKRLASDMTR